MRLSIGHRLFAAALIAFIAVAASGIALLRWQWLGGTTPPQDESAAVDTLVAAIAQTYRGQRDWSFLPTAPDARKRWLSGLSARTIASETPSSDATATSFAWRIGLLDGEQRHVAGVIAHPLLVAFASIDTQRRAVVVDGRTVGYLVVAKPESADDALAVAFLLQQQDALGALILLGLVACAAAALLLAVHVRRPIGRLVSATRRLGDGHYDAALPLARRDELGDLARAFDALAAKLAAAERARRHWTADTSHELRTPLAILRGQLEALQDGIRAPTREHLAMPLQQVALLTRRIDALHDLARADVGQLRIERTPLDLWQLVQETAAAFADGLRTAGLALSLGEAPPPTSVQGDPQRLQQVVANLLENCMRYTDRGGAIRITAAIVGETAHIVIDDTAPGVDAESLARLGERFFRTDAARARQANGAGVGLALSRQILAAHDGTLSFAASPLGGLRATIALPREP